MPLFDRNNTKNGTNKLNKLDKKIEKLNKVLDEAAERNSNILIKWKKKSLED